MRNSRCAVWGFVSFFCLSIFAGAFPVFAPAAAAQPGAIAVESRDFSQIILHPLVDCDTLTLTLSGPGGLFWTQEFGPGRIPAIRAGDKQSALPDGQYQYELVASPRIDPATRSAMETARESGDTQQTGLLLTPPLEPFSGSFLVSGGKIVPGDGVEADYAAPWKGSLDASVVNPDSFIVQGSLCVGADCTSDEVFGFDTIRLRENSLRIKFDDTSTSAGFPANDWQITANDSASGGANKFSIEDVTGGKIPFTITAGAPSSSLFVGSTGNLGVKTSTPMLDIHIKRSDSPSLRMEQDSSGGWTAQTWDVVGNETNFFIRDVTGGSKLPFRIKPGAPTNSIAIAADGNVGFGTIAPSYPLHAVRTGSHAVFMAERTDGAKAYINASATGGNFGTASNHPMRIATNDVTRLTVNTDNSMTMANGASLTAGGVWTNASSRQLKENILDLTAEEALLALAGLNPVKFNYRDDPSEDHVGFIAEDVPDLVATGDRSGLSPMDIVAVLTKVVQEQQLTIQDLSERIRKLENR